ncbi:MAG: hypothetical protein WCO25_01165 [Candidatus Uhrbacteria bacterium]
MSKVSKQGRVSIRTSTQEARTVLDPAEEAERALNRALCVIYHKIGAELSQPRDGWVQYHLGLDYGIGDNVQQSLERLSRSSEPEREVFATVLALEIWADDCENDLWATTFEEEMYWLEALHEIPYEARCW